MTQIKLPADLPLTLRDGEGVVRRLLRKAARWLRGRPRVEPYTGPASLRPRRPGERRRIFNGRVIVTPPPLRDEEAT